MTLRASEDTRLIRCVDGLNLSFAMLEQAYGGLHEACAAIPTNDSSNLTLAFWKAWAFVDVVHRLREIAEAVPGLNRKSADRRAIFGSTAIAEEFRHYIQHLRSELSKNPGNTFPVWGTLAWVDPGDATLSHIAMARAQVGEMSFTGCVFDTVNFKWVSNVCLGVQHRSLNFDPVYSACMAFKEFVVPWIFKTFTLALEVKGVIPIISMRILIKPKDGA